MEYENAIDALTRENAELSFAFYGFVSLVSGYMTKGLSFDAKALADEYERLAREAGEELAKVTGEPPSPNTHLQFLADMMRRTGKPVTLTAIKGGRALDEDEQR